VNHHYGLELSKVFGGGTMSSSDGQRFPVRGKSLTGRDMIIHGGRVLSTYTHVSDQWSTYGTKIIVPTAREAHFALDEFLGNATICRSPSTRQTLTAPRSSTSGCSTWWGRR
jgi:TnpA family transposase